MKFKDYIKEAKKKKLEAGDVPLLKQILKDRKKGLVMSQSQSMKVQSIWMRYFGQGGVSHYPNMDEHEMLKDLLELAGLK